MVSITKFTLSTCHCFCLFNCHFILPMNLGVALLQFPCFHLGRDFRMLGVLISASLENNGSFPLLQTRWDLEDQVHTSTFFDCLNFSVPSVHQSTWQLRNQHAQHFWSIHYTPLLAIWYAFTLQQEVAKLWNALASPNLIWGHSFSSLQYDSIL